VAVVQIVGCDDAIEVLRPAVGVAVEEVAHYIFRSHLGAHGLVSPDFGNGGWFLRGDVGLSRHGSQHASRPYDHASDDSADSPAARWPSPDLASLNDLRRESRGQPAVERAHVGESQAWRSPGRTQQQW